MKDKGLSRGGPVRSSGAAVDPADRPSSPILHPSSFILHHLGLIPYRDALALQRRLAEQRAAEQRSDTLLLLEHPPVFTFGRRGSWGDVLVGPERLAELGIEVVETNR